MIPLITALLPVLGEVLDRVIPDKNAAEKAKLEMQAKLLDAANAANAQQVEINKVEAASSSIFVAGWRPFLGWVCGVAMAYQYVVRPLLPWLVITLGGDAPAMPSLDESLQELVLAMLGLGGLRTFEKIRGVTS